ncbi:MAG TPA: SPFH domain-containing protein [Candidatus Acidoferrales bacterium]|nr:SPFH domain-containing protein [Candidatus Acidoferrales bacterium]
MPDFLTSAPLLTVALVVILILLIAFVATRYRVANANEALVVSGARGASVRDERGQELRASGDKGIKVVVGGGTFVMPLLNRVGRLKLTARQINVQLTDAVTSQGIKVQVQGVATFKIGRDVESLRNAAERFLDTPDQQVDSIVKNVLEGSLRSILGTLTIEELIRDRQKLLQQVQDAARGDLATSGLLIDAFNIQSFSDESNYVDLLGQQNLATVERDARMAKATADQQAAVREAEAQQIKINAQRDVQLKQADVLTQVAAAQARADQAGPLAQAEATQEVVRRQTELAQLEADRKEKELLSVTVKPAAADAQAAIERAEGQKRATIAAAEAQAEQVRLQGGAEAMVVLTKGEAEAKALAMRADAYKQFNEAALIQTVMAALPEIVRAAAEPLSRIDSLTVLSSDGASDVVRTATRTVAESAAVIRGLTGFDVPGLIGAAMHKTFTPAAGPPPQTPSEDGGSASAGPATPATSEAAVASGAPDAAPGPRPSAVRAALSKAGAVAGTSAAAAVGEAKQVQSDDATLLQWAKWLAGELRGVAGIASFSDVTLAQLASRGPRPAQALWRTAEDALIERYGKVTVGELLQRFPEAGPQQPA